MIFLSHPLNQQTPTYRGKDKISIDPCSSIERGDTCNKLSLFLTNHTSTHVDTPLHFIPNGKSITSYQPQDWVFNTTTLLDLELPVTESTLLRSLASRLPLDFSSELLLIKTGFEKARGTSSYYECSPGVSLELAQKIVETFPRLKAVGIDIISFSSPQWREEGRMVHHFFLSRDIRLIEDMKLSALSGSPQQVWVSPLLLENADGSPVTVFARV